MYLTHQWRTGTLADKLDQSTLRTHLRRLLNAPAGASRRQLKRLRDIEAQKCKDAYLSDDDDSRLQAGKRLDDIHVAFECLTDPKAFRTYLERANDRIIQGSCAREDILSSGGVGELSGKTRRGAADAAGFGPSGSSGEVVTPTGPSAPVGPATTPTGPSAVDTESSAVALDGSSLADEKQRIKELREKRKPPTISRKKKGEVERRTREALTAISEVASEQAMAKAQELAVLGRDDPDEFYERVYAAARESAVAVRDDAVSGIKSIGVPVGNVLMDELDTAVEDAAENATEIQYDKLEGTVARVKQKEKRGVVFIALVALTGVAVTFLFCNVVFLVQAQKPDAIGDQFAADEKQTEKIENIDAVLEMSLSKDRRVAMAVGLPPAAGAAGMAGGCDNYDVVGASDYNVALQLVDKGDYQAASDRFVRVMIKNDKLFQPIYNRGVISFYNGRLPAARADFTNTLKMRSDLTQAYYNRAGVYHRSSEETIGKYFEEGSDSKLKQKMYEKSTEALRTAIRDYTQAAQYGASLAQPIYNRGLARYCLGDLDGASIDFRRAAKKDTKVAAYSYARDFVSDRLQNPDSPIDMSKLPEAPVGPQGPPGPGYF